MEKLDKLFLILSFMALLYSCQSQKVNSNKMQEISLEIKPVFAGMNGFGNIYKCEVLEIYKGDYVVDSIIVVILAEDKAFLNVFLENDTNILVSTFEQRKIMETNSLPSYSGFIDKNKIGWQMKSVITHL